MKLSRSAKKDFDIVDTFLSDEWDSRAGSLPNSHPYIRSVKRAAQALRRLGERIEKLNG